MRKEQEMFSDQTVIKALPLVDACRIAYLAGLNFKDAIFLLFCNRHVCVLINSHCLYFAGIFVTLRPA